MRIALLTSTGLRHAYVANRLREHFDLQLVLREEKGLKKQYADHPDRELIESHFQHLADTEERFFGGHAFEGPNMEMITVPWGALNTGPHAQLLRDLAPDAVAVFGCGIIRSPVLDELPEGRTFNIHQGLSPYYRGGATNFWPFVDGAFHMIGVTLHLIDAGVDTGGIIAHERPDIEPGDDQHSIGCKTIIKSADLLVQALQCLEQGRALDAVPQWKQGKLCKRKDLTGEAIRTARAREARGEVADYVEQRQRGETLPLQLIRLDV